MFPYAIASICPIWRDITLSVPEFWERLVILIDSPATPLSAIVSFLSWSRHTPLDVTITRRWDSEDPMNGQPELTQIIAIMNILGPHLHRIHDLRFDVTFSSSLPSFPSDFRGSATILERLELRCRQDDGGRDRNILIALPTTEHEEFECPKLVYLVIDGRNFLESSRTHTKWIDEISHIDHLTISHLALHPGESFSTYGIALPLTASYVTTLHITNLELKLGPQGFESVSGACRTLF
jgi:hypothetical protein